MDTRQSYAVGLALVAVGVVASALASPEMPARMATHWNAAGVADGRTPKVIALATIPAVSAGLLALFAVLPRLDPLGENVAAFREQYDAFVVLVVGMLTYLHLLVLAWNAGFEFGMIQALAPAMGVVFYYAGVVLERAEQNWFVGIRTPWTLSDEEVWRRTHDRAAPLFKLAGVVAALGAVVPSAAILLIVVPVVAVGAYATAYSYLVHRRVAG
ncbi:SdpI family protein [Halorussus marinus]|uniref:SdpI family protein n=1 Tax=Halorussus marinus TaxID=2505976 RepID=UPI00106E1BF1|nr:SdpI family protein [Halorussus marinus]